MRLMPLEIERSWCGHFPEGVDHEPYGYFASSRRLDDVGELSDVADALGSSL